MFVSLYLNDNRRILCLIGDYNWNRSKRLKRLKRAGPIMKNLCSSVAVPIDMSNGNEKHKATQSPE